MPVDALKRKEANFQDTSERHWNQETFLLQVTDLIIQTSGGIDMMTFSTRTKVENRFKDYCIEHGIDMTFEHFLCWLAMMQLLDEDAINELPEVRS